MRLPPNVKTTLLLPTNLNLNFLNAFITPKKILDVDKVTFFFHFIHLLTSPCKGKVTLFRILETKSD